jgi:uncharacterized protein DUF3761
MLIHLYRTSGGMNMRIRVAAVTCAALLAAGTALAGCNPDTTTGSSSPSTAATTVAGSGASTGSVTVPPLTGLGLQTAQDTAQAHGFHDLTSHDASGQDRMQILDSNWKVCDQTPAAGTSATADVRIDLGAVKLGEACPGGATSAPSPTAAPSTSPATPTTPSATRAPTHKPVAHHTATSRGTTSGGSGSSGSSTSGGSGGSTTHRTEAPVAPGGGATAQCNDGTLSYSRHHQGTCSHHGGVAVWYK